MVSLILLTTQTMVTTGILPHKENPHGRTGNRTRDLVISSQKLWQLDHETAYNDTIFKFLPHTLTRVWQELEYWYRRLTQKRINKITLFHRPFSREFEVVYYSRLKFYDSDTKTHSRSRITDQLTQQHHIQWVLSELRLEVTAYVIFPSSQTFNFLPVEASLSFCIHNLQISHIRHSRETVDSLFSVKIDQFLHLICVWPYIIDVGK